MIKDMGTLYGVGVGPGEPGLVTLKAVEIINKVPVVAFPVNKPGAGSRAFDAVASHLSGSARLLPLLMPMTRDPQILKEAHEAAVEAVIATASTGDDVACLALGDPLFYSTFGYIAESFPGPVEVVGGVSAISAMAAALGQPLADGDTPLVVVTGKAHDALASALAMNASIVIIKPRSLSMESLDLLDQAGVWDRAWAAIELGGTEERVISELDRETAAALPYFAILWIQPSPGSGP